MFFIIKVNASFSGIDQEQKNKRKQPSQSREHTEEDKFKCKNCGYELHAD